jgi:hypothetical protein
MQLRNMFPLSWSYHQAMLFIKSYNIDLHLLWMHITNYHVYLNMISKMICNLYGFMHIFILLHSSAFLENDIFEIYFCKIYISFPIKYFKLCIRVFMHALCMISSNNL